MAWSISETVDRLLEIYDYVRSIEWKWQSLDSISIKAPLGGRAGPNPTDRGKLGTKRHVIKDKKGVPLSVVTTAANTHDMKAATNTLDNVIVKRPLNNRICVVTKDTTFIKKKENLAKEDTSRIFVT